VSALLARVVHFLGRVARAQARDNVSLHAGALAYATLVSLVPLLTVALVTVARFQPERAELVVRAMATMLPYSPARVQATLTMFAERTVSLGWPAVVVSAIVALFTLYQIDEVINTVWGVPHRRPWRWRLVSFLLVLFWGPMLLTILFSGLFWLSSQPWYRAVAPAARPLPAVFAFFALTGLYRWVPHTRVRWRAALAGAAAATVLLVALHLGFQAYVSFASDLNVIYGSLSLLLFLLVSIYLLWLAILLGVEVSWVVGHDHHDTPPSFSSVLALLRALAQGGAVAGEELQRVFGERSDRVLATLQDGPALLDRDESAWRLALPPTAVTVALVCARLGVLPPDDTPPHLLATSVADLSAGHEEATASGAGEERESPAEDDS